MRMVTAILLSCLLCFSTVYGAKMKKPAPYAIPVQTKQPDEQKIYPLAIIGAGAGGTMATQRAVLNNYEVLLFSGALQEQRHSRGNWVKKVNNIPGCSKYNRTVLDLRNETLEELVHSPFGNNLYIIEDSVKEIKKEPEYFILVDGRGNVYYAQYVILATGVMDEQPLIQNSIRPILKFANAQQVAYCPVCDGHRCFGKKTAVVGYSRSAAGMAIYLKEMYRLQELTLLTNGHTPAYCPEMQKVLEAKNVVVREEPIANIIQKEGNLAGFRFENNDTVDIEMAYVALGLRPNNELAIKLGARLDKRGLVITNQNGETSVPNCFAIGDLRSGSLKQIYTAWQQAVDAVQTIEALMR